jgi:hypothetical protein
MSDWEKAKGAIGGLALIVFMIYLMGVLAKLGQ